MRRLVIILASFIVLVLSYYIGKNYFKGVDYSIKINNFTMTKEEFEDYFRQMNLGGEDNPEARKNVLEALINKKLILQEAEKEGLDKSKEFLKNLESYYEQLLFKLILDKKSKELGSRVRVKDEEVRQRYNQLLEKNLITKPLEKVYAQIKWQLFREKQTQALEEWLKELKSRAKIEIKSKEILNK